MRQSHTFVTQQLRLLSLPRTCTNTHEKYNLITKDKKVQPFQLILAHKLHKLLNKVENSRTEKEREEEDSQKWHRIQKRTINIASLSALALSN